MVLNVWRDLEQFKQTVQVLGNNVKGRFRYWETI